MFNKPSGLASHRTGDPTIPDLLNWARAEHGAPESLAPCHRLDRATSGVIVCSSEPGVRTELGNAFAQGRVQKRYLALVHGRPPKGGTIARALHDRRRGKKLEAETTFRRQAVYQGVATLECVPRTGRKHQIRRHLRGMGCPIWGDTRYGRTDGEKNGPGRLWLHASSLVLPDGREFIAALPDELLLHLNRLAGDD